MEYKTKEEVKEEIKRVFPNFKEEGLRDECLKFIEENLRIRRRECRLGLIEIKKELEEELECEKKELRYLKECEEFEVKSIEYKKEIAELRIEIKVKEELVVKIEGAKDIVIEEGVRYKLKYGVMKEKIGVCKKCGARIGGCDCGVGLKRINRKLMIEKEVDIKC